MSSFIGDLSHCSIRLIVLILVAVSFAGPVLVIVGVGIFTSQTNFDEQRTRYNAALENFQTTSMDNVLRSNGKLWQQLEDNQTASYRAFHLLPMPTNQPIPGGAKLPSSSIVQGANINIESIPLATNLTAHVDATAFPAVITLVDAVGRVTNITTPPLFEPVQKATAARCYHAGDAPCNRTEMQRMCRAQTGCANANYTGTNNACPPGKACPGCVFSVYQSVMCLPVTYNNRTGTFSLSSTFASCKYPFRPETQPTACASNFPAVDVLIMEEGDPFIVAQNMTKGTMFFYGMSAVDQRDTGIALLAGGAALTVLAIAAWYAFNVMTRVDIKTIRHVYAAFGQEFIPSTRDYVHAHATKKSYQLSHGFVPSTPTTPSPLVSSSTAKAKSAYVPPAVAAGTAAAMPVPRQDISNNSKINADRQHWRRDADSVGSSHGDRESDLGGVDSDNHALLTLNRS